MPKDDVLHAYRTDDDRLVIVTCPFCGRHHVHDVDGDRLEAAIHHRLAPCTARPYAFTWHAYKSIAPDAVELLRLRDEEPERLVREPELMRQLCAVLDEVQRLALDDQPGWKKWRHEDDHYPDIPSAVLVLLKRYHWKIRDEGGTVFGFIQGYRPIGIPAHDITYSATHDAWVDGGIMTYAELRRLAQLELFKSFVSRHGDTLFFNEDAQAAVEDFCHAVYGAWAMCCDRLEWLQNSQSEGGPHMPIVPPIPPFPTDTARGETHEPPSR